MKKQHEFATRAIHAGQEPDPSYRRGDDADLRYINVGSGESGKDRMRRRSINPTAPAYEKCIADLESGTRGLCFASGLLPCPRARSAR